MSRRAYILLSAGAVLSLLLIGVAWPLPDQYTTVGGPTSLRLTDRQGTLLREMTPEGRGQPVHPEALPPLVVTALLATEDHRFYEHLGIDPVAVARAVRSNLRAGEIVSGASTLTMQVARTVRGPSRRGWPAKIAEAFLALRLEWHLSKADILALWLSRVPFGHQTHGLEAAAQAYFGKTAPNLTEAEGTFLIGLPQSPSRYNPLRHPERARARHRQVVQGLVRRGVLSEEAAARLLQTPLALRPAAQAFRAPHFTTWLAQKRPQGTSPVVEMRTTLDATLQETAEAVVRGHLQTLDASVTNAAAVIVDNATGALRAYVGSADFWSAQHGGQNDGLRMRRQPGSTLKPFAYGLALASGRYTAATILPDVPLQVAEAGGAFSPENYDRTFHGPVPLRQALASSYNVPAVYVARALSPQTVLDGLRQAGLTSLHRRADEYGVGLVLGNGEVSLLELTYAYASLGRGGLRPPQRAYTWARTAAGDTLRPAPAAPAPTGLSPEVAFLLTDILTDPEARAPGFGRDSPLSIPFPMAVKTGTTKDYRDTWALGVTPRYTIGVWVGNFNGAPMRWVSGVRGAGPILRALALHLGSGGSFARPPSLVQHEVCPASGHRPAAHCPTRQTAWFLPGTFPHSFCTVHQLIHEDHRTGLLADAETPPEAVRERLYTVHPPRYHAWMRDQGLPLPPTARGTDLDTALPADEASALLRVHHPASGTRYHLDPVLDPTYQRVKLEAVVDPTLHTPSWWVDGRRLEQPFDATYWPLEPGTHRLEVRAVDAEGRLHRSAPVDVQVEGRAPSTR